MLQQSTQYQQQVVPGGNLTKIHRRAQTSHEVSSTPSFHCFHQWFFHPFWLAEIPSNYHERRQIISPHQIFTVVDKRKPLYLDYTMQVQLAKNTSKTWKKWLNLLLDFGQVPPPLWGSSSPMSTTSEFRSTSRFHAKWPVWLGRPHFHFTFHNIFVGPHFLPILEGVNVVKTKLKDEASFILYNKIK